jgi:hypothetical protein
MELKHYLFRDHGMILFSSISDNEQLYWLSFLSGGHADWTYYIKVTQSEFVDVWQGQSTLRDLHKKYSRVRMSATDSTAIENKHNLLAAIDLHNMPKAMVQMHFKSEVPIES